VHEDFVQNSVLSSDYKSRLSAFPVGATLPSSFSFLFGANRTKFSYISALPQK
jgi:hypothetical protein